MLMCQGFSPQAYGGGLRGYEDACAVESHSNDISPTIKTVEGFTVIVEPYDIEDTTSHEKRLHRDRTRRGV